MIGPDDGLVGGTALPADEASELRRARLPRRVPKAAPAVSPLGCLALSRVFNTRAEANALAVPSSLHLSSVGGTRELIPLGLKEGAHGGRGRPMLLTWPL